MDERFENQIHQYWQTRVKENPAGAATEMANLEILQRMAKDKRVADERAKVQAMYDLHTAHDFVIDKAVAIFKERDGAHGG